MRWTLLVSLLATVVVPLGEAHAQDPAAEPTPAQRVCTLRVDPGGVTSGEGAVVNIHDPFRVVCTDGANLRASSGVYDRLAQVVTLTGDVYFEDQTRTLTSDRAVYNSLLGMLHATGNVVFDDRVEGTTLTGPELEYYRANAQRADALVNAFGRPRLTLRQRPTASSPDGDAEEAAPEAAAPVDTTGTPLTIDADRMTIEGRNDLTAVGSVVIQDDEMRAVADEAEQRGSSETLELRGGAEIHSQEYSLAANVIFATVPDGNIEEVEARGRARLLGDELNVEAPRLDLLFQEQLLQRSIARSDEALEPGVRPVTTSPTFRLEADSIDASLPGQRLETVVAIGNARGETIDTTRATALVDSAGAGVDSLPAGAEAVGEDGAGAGVEARFATGDSVTTVSAAELVENDWITGDTITGYFSSVVAAAADTTSEAPGEIADDGEQNEAEYVQVEGALEPSSEVSDTTLVMERLVAVGAARSLYHVAPEAGSPPGTRRGINFLSAAHIELRFSDGQVQVANVDGLRRGLYLEPLAVGATPADTADEEVPDAGNAGEEGTTPAEPDAADDQAEDDEAPGPEPDLPQTPGVEP